MTSPETDIYGRLRERLDRMATGFPVTNSGVEIRILKRLFEEAEAGMFLKLSGTLETPEDAAARLGLDPAETARTLERMASRGLLFRRKKDGRTFYNIIPYVMGIFEYQVARMTPDMARDMDLYFREAFGRTLFSLETPPVRSIPVNRELTADRPIAPHEDALRILSDQTSITAAPCVCRTKARLTGHDCGKPLETCFIFGTHGDYYAANRMGRRIGLEEAIAILNRCEDAGLVIQPANARKAGVMCCCCGCCCDMLNSLKMQPDPARRVRSNHFAAMDPDLCTGCGECATRCPMEALTAPAETVVVDRDRCIGCGLCVKPCPTAAMRLVRKPEEDCYDPPPTSGETYARIARERAGRRKQ